MAYDVGIPVVEEKVSVAQRDGMGRPEVNLLCEIVKLAVDDWRRSCARITVEGISPGEMRASIRVWLEGGGSPVPFQYACDQIGLNAVAVREAFYRYEAVSSC